MNLIPSGCQARRDQLRVIADASRLRRILAGDDVPRCQFSTRRQIPASLVLIWRYGGRVPPWVPHTPLDEGRPRSDAPTI